MKRQPISRRISPSDAREQLEALSARARPERSAEPTTTTAVHLPRRTLALLRRVATERANRDGGRASVSAVIVGLVEAQREELERETQRE